MLRSLIISPSLIVCREPTSRMRLRFDCQHRYESGFQLDAQFEAAGPVTALFGPSGSGKTTVLTLVAGLLKPGRGTIRLGDRSLVDTHARIWLPPERRNVGLLLQDHCLFPHMSVRNNLLYGVRRRRREGIPLARVVEMLELEGLLDRSPRSLSGGQQQRVALGRAILPAPELLLLDEPLTAVQTELRDRIADFIERVVAEFRIPTLLVSHNRELVDRLATEVLQIDAGRIVG